MDRLGSGDAAKTVRGHDAEDIAHMGLTTDLVTMDGHPGIAGSEVLNADLPAIGTNGHNPGKHHFNWFGDWHGGVPYLGHI